MSLDGLDLVMRIEETFELTIPDEEAEKIYTVGDLHAYLVYHLGKFGRLIKQTSSPPCPIVGIDSSKDSE